MVVNIKLSNLISFLWKTTEVINLSSLLIQYVSRMLDLVQSWSSPAVPEHGQSKLASFEVNQPI